MYQETPVICQHCKQHSGFTQEGLSYFAIMCDLLCRNCGKILIYATRYETSIMTSKVDPSSLVISNDYGSTYRSSV